MINAIMLFGSLILTLVGFVVPILTILISFLPEGTKFLISKYENERKQSEENIINETKKKEAEKGLDYGAIENTLNTLKKKKRDAENKLKYLNPNQFLLRNSIPFSISLLGVIIALVCKPLFTVIAISVSIIALIVGLKTFLVSISVLFEVAEIVNRKRSNSEEKIIELLSTLVEKSGDNLYIKSHEINIGFNGRILKPEDKYDFSINTKHEIPVTIYNKSEKMAKNLEVGFIFPKEVVVENSSSMTIYTSDSNQIVRFNNEIIQARENNIQEALQITFLKSGEIAAQIFIKGENVKYQKYSFKLNIVA